MENENRYRRRSSKSRCPTLIHYKGINSSITRHGSFSTFSDILEHTTSVKREAMERIEKRLFHRSNTTEPKLEQFFKENPFFASVYVVNGISKTHFAKRIIYQRSNFDPEGLSSSKYRDVLMQMEYAYPTLSNQKKAEILEKLSSLCGHPPFVIFLLCKTRLQVVADIFELSFENKHVTLIELAAFAATTLIINMPEEVSHHNIILINIFCCLLVAIKESFARVTEYARNLTESNNKYLERLTERSKKFSYERYQSRFGDSHHLVGSILYYAISLMLGRSYSPIFLNCVVECALTSYNPLQFLLLKITENHLIHLKTMQLNEHRFLVEPCTLKFMNALFKFKTSERICDDSCRELLDRCIDAAQSFIRGPSALRINSWEKSKWLKNVNSWGPTVTDDTTSHFIENAD